jgi:hypothetical protein
MRVATTPWVMLAWLALACSLGTEPSTNPREQRIGPGETGGVSGRVVTSGTARSTGARQGDGAGDSAATGWRKLGPLEGETIQPSRPIAGVVVELGIVHFGRSSDSAATGTSRSLLVPMALADVWAGSEPRVLDPGPAAPPGRFEVIAQATTNGRGEFRFSRAPRGEMLMVRARPPTPHVETYSSTPFLLGNQAEKVVDVILRAGPR